MKIEIKDWKWFGDPGHFICARDCEFHLCTQVGEYLISTVGKYFPDSNVRDILAESRKVELEGIGDDRRYDYMKKIGYEEIGFGRKFETMVFKFEGICKAKDCNCGLPVIIPAELDSAAYNDSGAANKGHFEMCIKWADSANSNY